MEIKMDAGEIESNRLSLGESPIHAPGDAAFKDEGSQFVMPLPSEEQVVEKKRLKDWSINYPEGSSLQLNQWIIDGLAIAERFLKMREESLRVQAINNLIVCQENAKFPEIIRSLRVAVFFNLAQLYYWIDFQDEDYLVSRRNAYFYAKRALTEIEQNGVAVGDKDKALIYLMMGHTLINEEVHPEEDISVYRGYCYLRKVVGTEVYLHHLDFGCIQSTYTSILDYLVCSLSTGAFYEEVDSLIKKYIQLGEEAFSKGVVRPLDRVQFDYAKFSYASIIKESAAKKYAMARLVLDNIKGFPLLDSEKRARIYGEICVYLYEMREKTRNDLLADEYVKVEIAFEKDKGAFECLSGEEQKRVACYRKWMAYRLVQ